MTFTLSEPRITFTGNKIQLQATAVIAAGDPGVTGTVTPTVVLDNVSYSWPAKSLNLPDNSLGARPKTQNFTWSATQSQG